MINRRVYYISGFDPRGSRFYHRLFREEAKKSEEVSGASISTSKRKVLDEVITQWDVHSTWDGKAYKIDYRFMTWDDVMKHYWVSNVWKLILKSITMYYRQSKIRLFSKYKQAGKGPYFFSLYPLAFFIASLLISILVSGTTYAIVAFLFHQVWLAALFSIVLTYFFVQYAMKLGEKMGAWWVMQSYFLHARWIEKPLPDLEVKTQAFAERILQDQLESPVNEVIIAGHCTGAMLTVSVIAKLLNLNHECLNNKLSVMTLGQSIPYVSYAQPASHFRKQLQIFANNQYFPWFDMGARADPLCFQQVNPALADGITLNDESVPYRVVVKPYKMFSSKKYNELKKNKLRIHFQYLMAADLKTDFDYFEIVTGHPAKLHSYKNV